MTYAYFPSCQFTALMPGVSARIRDYMASRGAAVMGCCRKDHARFSGTPVTICQTCRIIIEENHPGSDGISLWEAVDADPDFPFPDCSGMTVTVQDCYRARGRETERAAVRSLLKKLGIRTVELPGTEEELSFDGAWLYRPVMPGNLHLAPRRFGEIAKDICPLPEEEITARLKRYCRRFTTDTVVCTCRACLLGLRTGLPEGSRALHLAELLFPEG